MKPICLLLLGAVLCCAPGVRAQDAATEERLNKLSAQIEDLRAAQELQQKNITGLAREIEGLRGQQVQPGAFASQDDARKLAEKLQEIEKNRQADKELILKEIEKLGKPIGSSASGRKAPAEVRPAPAEKSASPGAGSEKGYTHTILKDDTLTGIVQAYKEKGIKVTVDQILKANPGLKPNNMPVGKEIFIPAPAP